MDSRSSLIRAYIICKGIFSEFRSGKVRFIRVDSILKTCEGMLWSILKCSFFYFSNVYRRHETYPLESLFFTLVKFETFINHQVEVALADICRHLRTGAHFNYWPLQFLYRLKWNRQNVDEIYLKCNLINLLL